MVVYIRKRLNIFMCIPNGAGAEGGGVGCMVSRQPSLTCRTRPPLRAISRYAPATPQYNNSLIAFSTFWDNHKLSFLVVYFINYNAHKRHFEITFTSYDSAMHTLGAQLLSLVISLNNIFKNDVFVDRGLLPWDIPPPPLSIPRTFSRIQGTPWGLGSPEKISKKLP